MKPFNKYFDNSSLIKVIVNYRISLANKRHDFHFFNDLGQTHLHSCPIKKTEKSIDTIIYKILPSRRSWIRYGKENRQEFNNSTSQLASSLEKTIFLHKKSVSKKTSTSKDWFTQLRIYLEEIHQCFKDVQSYSFTKPLIIPEKKNKGKKPEDKLDKAHRPIAHFKLLKDKILIGQTAKYLTDTIDKELSHSAFAFRSRQGRVESITHHDAIEKIKQFIQKNQGKQLWVAECDIKKFYDCINQSLVKKCLSKILLRLESNNIKVDKKAIQIFNAYLDSYAFNIDVEPQNDTPEYIAKNIFFEWERDNLIKEFYKDGINDRLGVPQGGAISCLIANIIMDEVDRSVLQIEKSIQDENLLYVRYCDDMVIMHTDKNECSAALQRYQTALQDVKLLCHNPLQVNSDQKNYFEAKSKLPYRLSPFEEGVPCAPWLAFVGYQIRYDGIIRIRKKSLKKEIEKQNLVVYKTIKKIKYKDKKQLDKNARRSASQIAFRVEQRLISMSVGRVCLYDDKKNEFPQLSWTVGFKKLNRNPVLEKQMKQLDRNREKQLKKLVQKLKHLKIENTGKAIDKDNDTYFGSPYSYHNFIIKK